MKLHKLLVDLSWNEVKEALLRNYDDSEKSIEGYEKVFFKLLKMVPIENKMKIGVSYVDVNEFNDEPYWHVYGHNGTLQRDTNDANFFQDASEEFLNSEVSYAIELTPWNEWIGMEIDEETLSNVNLTMADIVAHCMWEMTFCGFEEEVIKERLDSLVNAVEEIKNSSEEELKKKTITMKELKEKLEKDFKGEDDD